VNHPPRYRVLARPRSPEEALAPQPFPPRGACVTVSSQGEHSEGPVIAQGHREHPPEYPAEPPGLRWARVISGGAGGTPLEALLEVLVARGGTNSLWRSYWGRWGGCRSLPIPGSQAEAPTDSTAAAVSPCW
jgi:hypothetical protein